MPLFFWRFFSATVLVDAKSFVAGVSEIRSISTVYDEVYRLFFTALFFLTSFPLLSESGKL